MLFGRSAIVYLYGLIFFFLYHEAGAQRRVRTGSTDPVYIDKQGVLRYSGNRQEAAFFGVNYTTPFAYAYRAHKKLGVDMEEAIRRDVYHFARLGFDAFRVHVWDTEISDTAGNLLNNEHLRLFDFLLAELKKRNIKTLITPIAFWGNGYPERDEHTPGFSRKYGKSGATVNDTAIRAQENYLRQFFSHRNPYTRTRYQDDPHVIAVEINNEPSHSGPKTGVTHYINRLAAAIRSTGWTKPVFYNISQSPYYADAVAASVAQGFSFQWYPSGLVRGQSLKGNYLPHVSTYEIPFDDTIAAFAKKALMVYEFDAADIMQPYMYPAMARSFRGAGFQWATQFAYDPLALAHANTEYQTHYLNLAYTPSKAISMMIASEVFHRVPRLKRYGSYPADTLFDVFRLSYAESLSEMNTDTAFYYSNSTSSTAVRPDRLKHIAGVGSSDMIQYAGSGAYFLDQLEPGVWRLEVMPDAIPVRDPFERASPEKTVTAIQWNRNAMRIALPDLGASFSIRGLDNGNNLSGKSEGERIVIGPGTYLLVRQGNSFAGDAKMPGVIGLNEFVAPPPSDIPVMIRHEPYSTVAPGNSFSISAVIHAPDTAQVTLQVSRMGAGPYRRIPMQREQGGNFRAEVPAMLVTPGLLTYRIIVQAGNDFTVFPGNYKGNPFAWDSYHNETWQTVVSAANTDVELYSAATDRNVIVYPPFRRNVQTAYVAGESPGSLVLQWRATGMRTDEVAGFQQFVGDKMPPYSELIADYDSLVMRARTLSGSPVNARLTLITGNGTAFSAICAIPGSSGETAIPLQAFKPDSCLLLPRPYPGFQPLWFRSGEDRATLSLKDVEKLEVLAGPGINPSATGGELQFEIEYIRLRKQY